MTAEERERLERFVTEVYDGLGEIIFNTEVLPADLGEDYRQAFHEADSSVEDTRRALWERTEEGSFAVSDDAFERAGLTGAQLNLKVSGWRRAWARFRNDRRPRILRRALRWANVLLGSLAGVIGAAEPLKELKEAVEAGVEGEE